MRRVLAVLVGAGIAVGGGAAAWAGTAGASGPRREAAKACLSQAREANPNAGRSELKGTVKACLEETGVEARTPTPEQQAKREALRSCVDTARKAHPDDKGAAHAAARSCLDQSGVTPGRLRAKVAGAKECLAKVREANPTAPKADVRRLVKDCVAAS